MIHGPLVSIIIPTFNRRNLVGDAIKSVLSQTYLDIEIIVIDDHSSDDTVELIGQEFKKEILEKKIILISNSRNERNAEAKNIGIRSASGTLIAFLDDDDVWLPKKLEIQVSSLENETADACFCATSWVEDGKILKQTLVRNNRISFENGCPTSTWLIRKEIFNKLGYFDPNIPTNDEGELLVRLNKGGMKSVFVNEPLYIHYYHSQAVSHSRQGKQTGLIAILKKHKEVLNNYEKSSIYLKLAVLSLLAHKKAFTYTLKSLGARLSISGLVILILHLLPTSVAKLILNRTLDLQGYPHSFAERYN